MRTRSLGWRRYPTRSRRHPASSCQSSPTAALDPVSAQRVVAGFGARMEGRTTIVITHRIELAAQADRIVVLDGARIVESGTAAVAR